MQEVWYQVQLETEVILSSNSATQGSQTTLDRLPGSVFLGWTAGRLYNRLPAEDAFTIFHSGRVRFGDALPCGDTEVQSLPMPLSMHKEKLGAKDVLSNLSSPDIERLKQPKQQRAGYLSASGQRIPSPQRCTRSRVSLAKRPLSRGGVVESSDNQLFVYESLAPGTTFLMSVQADGDVELKLFEQVTGLLSGAKVRLGRSRGSEYGQARVTRLQQPPKAVQPSSGQTGTEVRLLLLSDLALRCPTSGQPRLEVRPEDFHLPNAAELDLRRSYLRTRRYSPFNGKRKRPDLERQVLTQGSVLVFTGCAGVDVGQLHNDLRAGVGLYREQGLGQVSLNPSFLWKETLSPQGPVAEVEQTGSSVASLESDSLNDDPLTDFLRSRVGRKQKEKWLFDTSREWAEKLARERGPGRSQWGSLRQMAFGYSNGSKLYRYLFGDGQSSEGYLYSGVRQFFWNDPGKGRNGAEKWKALIEDELKGDYEHLPELIGRTATRVLHLQAKSSQDTQKGEQG